MRRSLCGLLTIPLLANGCDFFDGPPDQDGGPARSVTVYEIVGTDGPLRLTPVTVDVPRTSGPAIDAVRGLLGHKPTTKKRDSLWAGMCRPGAAVRSVRRSHRLVTVRLRGFGPNQSGDALCDLSRQGLRIQRQQVAWTVRKATGSRAPVKVVAGAHYVVMPPTVANRNALSAPFSAP